MKALSAPQRLALQAVEAGQVNDSTRASVASLIRRGLVIAQWRGDRSNSTYFLTTAGREALSS